MHCSEYFLKTYFLSKIVYLNGPQSTGVIPEMKVVITSTQVSAILIPLEFIIWSVILYMIPRFSAGILNFCNMLSGGLLSQEGIL